MVGGVSRTAVLVPVKDFREAKTRLAGRLDPVQRAALARRMATVVVKAASPLPVHVVCDDAEVAAWAEENGATVIWRPGRGLNPAITDGIAHLAGSFSRAIISHADLPLATELAWIGDFEGVTIVPDRHDDGTNVMSIPLPSGAFAFGYGGGSFAHHSAEARRLRHPLRIVRDPALGWDVDRPADLENEALASLLDTTP